MPTSEIESSLSPAELKWYRYGTDATSSAEAQKTTKGDAQLVLELNSAKKRAVALEAELSSINARVNKNKQKESINDDISNIINDPDYALSEAERKWMAGEDFATRAQQISVELRDLKGDIIRLEKNLNSGIRDGWKHLNYD